MNFLNTTMTHGSKKKQRVLPWLIGLDPAIKRKVLMRIQLTAFLILFTMLHLWASGSAQQLSMTYNNAPLKTVLEDITAQSGYRLWLNDRLLEQSKTVSINVKEASLKDVLDKCFESQPLTYEITNKTIVIKLKPFSPKDKLISLLQAIKITGTVKDEQGQPMPGVTVSVKGSNISTMTDAQGNYSITVDEKGTLVFSYIGYQSKEFSIKNSNIINLRLQPISAELDQVQIMAYGTTTQRLNTGNISSVKANEIEKQPVNNPLLALQGQVPGIFITPANGLPGSNVTVRIQGLNSIANGSDPFYVIDGVPYSSTPITSISNSLRNGISPLNFINPAMIESIEILKDADATAIYGSRAANGAILITTKKGIAGDTKVDLRMQHGGAKVGSKVNLMNTEQYLTLRRDAFKLDNKTPGPTDYDLNGTWDQNRYTDWQEELVGGTAQYQDAGLSVSGGNLQTQFRIGADYHRETSVNPGDLADQKTAISLTLNHRSANQRFTLNFSTNYMVDKNKMLNTDVFQYAIKLPPNAPALYNEDGSLNWGQLPNGNATWDNPLQNIEQRYVNATTNLISNVVLGYQLAPGLIVDSSFGYSNLQGEETVKTPLVFHQPQLRPTRNRTSSISNKDLVSWIIEPTLKYKRSLGPGKLDFLLGTTFQSSDNNALTVTGTGFASDDQMDNIAAAPTITIPTSVQSTYRYTALFGRINYNISNSYIVNLTARYDGSSRFGPENKFHTFYAVGAAWIFTEEQWLKNNLPILSFGKLKTSYGTTGSDQIGDYSFINLYGNVSGVQVPYQNVVGLSPTGHFNPYLQWEQTNKLNLGLDFGFFKDRILLNANYFHNRSSNQLVTTPLPFLTGYATIKTNLPAVLQNTGLELALNTRPIEADKFRWSSNLNFTIPRNKLVSFPDIENSTYAGQLKIGEPAGIQRWNRFTGVNPTTGRYQFVTTSGALSSLPAFADRVALIDMAPYFYGSFSNTLAYKGFELSFLWQFVKQKGLDYRFGINPGTMQNQPASIDGNYWQQAGDDKFIQRPATTSLTEASFASISDGYYTDASFLRLKNVHLSYSLPQQLIAKAGMTRASLFASAQNLLTFTGFDLDAETQTPLMMPTLKVVTLGLQIGF